jgi:hypothetical protein
MDNYTNVPVNSEAQLEKAVALGPVAVAIEADQSGFQSYVALLLFLLVPEAHFA